MQLRWPCASAVFDASAERSTGRMAAGSPAIQRSSHRSRRTPEADTDDFELRPCVAVFPAFPCLFQRSES